MNSFLEDLDSDIRRDIANGCDFLDCVQRDDMEFTQPSFVDDPLYDPLFVKFLEQEFDNTMERDSEDMEPDSSDHNLEDEADEPRLSASKSESLRQIKRKLGVILKKDNMKPFWLLLDDAISLLSSTRDTDPPFFDEQPLNADQNTPDYRGYALKATQKRLKYLADVLHIDGTPTEIGEAVIKELRYVSVTKWVSLKRYYQNLATFFKRPQTTPRYVLLKLAAEELFDKERIPVLESNHDLSLYRAKIAVQQTIRQMKQLMGVQRSTDKEFMDVLLDKLESTKKTPATKKFQQGKEADKYALHALYRKISQKIGLQRDQPRQIIAEKLIKHIAKLQEKPIPIFPKDGSLAVVHRMETRMIILSEVSGIDAAGVVELLEKVYHWLPDDKKVDQSKFPELSQKQTKKLSAIFREMAHYYGVSTRASRALILKHAVEDIIDRKQLERPKVEDEEDYEAWLNEVQKLLDTTEVDQLNLVAGLWKEVARSDSEGAAEGDLETETDNEVEEKLKRRRLG